MTTMPVPVEAITDSARASAMTFSHPPPPIARAT
jgi:hypothetical protein